MKDNLKKLSNGEFFSNAIRTTAQVLCSSLFFLQFFAKTKNVVEILCTITHKNSVSDNERVIGNFD